MLMVFLWQPGTFCSTHDTRSLEYTKFERTNSVVNNCFSGNCVCDPSFSAGDLCQPPGTSTFLDGFNFCTSNTLLDDHFGFNYTIPGGHVDDNIYYVITTNASGVQSGEQIMTAENAAGANCNWTFPYAWVKDGGPNEGGSIESRDSGFQPLVCETAQDDNTG